jgi:hypothetical protein
MTIAHPGADYCALCMVHGQLTRAIEEWPGAPICRAHVIACGGAEDPPDTQFAASGKVVDFRAARARLRSPPLTESAVS